MRHLLFVLSLLLAGCDLLNDSTAGNGTHRSTVTKEGIVYTAAVPSASFRRTDTLSVTFTVRNTTSLPRTFFFPNIQQLAFELIDRNNTVVMSYPSIVSPALSDFTVDPGSETTLRIQSLFQNWDGRIPAPGAYTLSVFLAAGNSPRCPLTIELE